MSGQSWVHATVDALAPLADPDRAVPMARYMKDVAPFLGISTPERRRALRAAWRPLPLLSPDEVSNAAGALWDRPEREYHYAACELIGLHQPTLPAPFLRNPLQRLIATKAWWDTVDLMETNAVVPLVARHPELVAVMWEWLDSGDRWLIRAAIQHQRGLKEATDLDRLFAMGDRFAADREFFIAKAIGWALRDVTRWNAPAVQRFVDGHPELSPVARREALRGLARSSRP